VRGKAVCFLIVTVFLIGAAGFFYSKKVTLLYLENMDHPRSVRVRVNPHERFSIFYVHSVYNAPAIEEFEVDQGGITLRGVRTENAGILEYYGFEDSKPFHPLDRKLGAIFFRVGMGQGQRFVFREKKISLSEIGARGERIQVRVNTLPLLCYLVSG
jgi:hypothetical protein